MEKSQKPVYVLTKSGMNYTKEGCERIYSIISTSFDDSLPIDSYYFWDGHTFNNPDLLRKRVEFQPDCYIAISYVEKSTGKLMIGVVSPEDIEEAIDVLKIADKNGYSSWEAIMVCLGEEENL